MQVIILDGYTDEPAGLGVPPYIDIYPRYIAGAIKDIEPSCKILYFTVDFVRSNFEIFAKQAEKSKMVIFIAGIVVPGKYLGGAPITVKELLKDNNAKELIKTLINLGMDIRCLSPVDIDEIEEI